MSDENDKRARGAYSRRNHIFSHENRVRLASVQAMNVIVEMFDYEGVSGFVSSWKRLFRRDPEPFVWRVRHSQDVTVELPREIVLRSLRDQALKHLDLGIEAAEALVKELREAREIVSGIAPADGPAE